MKHLLVIFFNVLHHYGLNGFLAFVIPVYFTQDTKLENGGYDILTLRKSKREYFRGTWKQRNELASKEEGGKIK